MSVGQFDERTPLAVAAQILPADGTGFKTLHTAPLSGSRLDDILLSSTGAAAHVITFALTIAATTYYVGSVSVPAGAGHAGAPPIQLGATVQPTNQLGWILGYNVSLICQLAVAMGAGEQMDIVAFGGAL